MLKTAFLGILLSATQMASAASMNVPCASGITVDGSVGEANWAGAWTPLANVDLASGAPVTATAQWKARWSSTYLYIAVDVSDTTPYADSGASAWDDDAVEVYVDMNHTKATTYDGNGEQFIFDYNLSTSIATKNAAHMAGVLKAVVEKAGNKGYVMEIAIPWSVFTSPGIAPGAGSVIGVDLALDSDYNGGGRDGQIVGYGDINDYTNMSKFGDLTLLSCAATPTATQTPMTCTTPGCATGWTVIGNGSVIANGVHLTDDLPNQHTAMWADIKLDLSSNFDVSFDLNFGTKDATGADGIAFVMQNDIRGLAALGDAGQGLSYGGVLGPLQAIQPSVDIEWDTWQNAGGGDPLNFNDPANDHTSIHLNGDANEANAPVGSVDASAVSANIEDGLWHRVRVTWNAASHTLQTYFDGSLRQTYVNDIVTNVFSGVSCVYWGFTSGTGGSSNIQEAKEVACYSPSPTFTTTPTPGTPSPTPTSGTFSPTPTASPVGTVTAPCASGMTIDGSLSESAWTSVGWTSLNLCWGGCGNAAQFKTLWDSTYLYVAVDVTDPALYNDSANNWEDDSVEIYFGTKPLSGTYDGNDWQWVLQYDNSGLQTNNGTTAGIVTGTSLRAGGYIQEWAIPWSKLTAAGAPSPAAGVSYGFDVGVNFDDNGGTRDYQLGWHGSNNAWNDPTQFGNLVLGACSTPTPSASPSATPSPTPSPSATPAMPITKSANVTQATIGDTITFCMDWLNDSSATQTMKIWDTLPASVTYLGCTSGCAQLGNYVSWSFSAASNSSGQVCVGTKVSSYP